MRVLLQLHFFLSSLLAVSASRALQENILVLETTFYYGLFDEAPWTQITQDHVDTLLTRTSDWYTEQLQQTLPSLESFEAMYTGRGIYADTDEPIQIHFNAVATFEDGKWESGVKSGGNFVLF